MDMASILLGGAESPPSLLLRYANRHGLIAGATGTGKTVSLQVMLEGLSARGVPVFASARLACCGKQEQTLRN